MKPLPPPDCHYFNAAIGWLELGNWREAKDELEQITPELQSHPDVLGVRADIYSAAGKWSEAAELAKRIADVTPEAPGPWIKWAYATRRMPAGGMWMQGSGCQIEDMLKRLSSEGLLSPRLAQAHEKHRAAEFKGRCKGLKIEGVTLHSYRRCRGHHCGCVPKAMLPALNPNAFAFAHGA